MVLIEPQSENDETVGKCLKRNESSLPFVTGSLVLHTLRIIHFIGEYSVEKGLFGPHWVVWAALGNVSVCQTEGNPSCRCRKSGFGFKLSLSITHQNTTPNIHSAIL